MMRGDVVTGRARVGDTAARLARTYGIFIALVIVVVALSFAPADMEIPMPPTAAQLVNPLAAENNEPLVPLAPDAFDPVGDVGSTSSGSDETADETSDEDETSEEEDG